MAYIVDNRPRYDFFTRSQPVGRGTEKCSEPGRGEILWPTAQPVGKAARPCAPWDFLPLREERVPALRRRVRGHFHRQAMYRGRPSLQNHHQDTETRRKTFLLPISLRLHASVVIMALRRRVRGPSAVSQRTAGAQAPKITTKTQRHGEGLFLFSISLRLRASVVITIWKFLHTFSRPLWHGRPARERSWPEPALSFAKGWPCHNALHGRTAGST
jgi:hypothetical protein